ncbi:MAG TPA: ABC-type transport auxiliary lipoprotein family protein, partial [Methyloceanibacter sp.]|nr:ABC-type transport auxiliary lipoprotein family protein [Methyloceanibacter sp.]
WGDNVPILVQAKVIQSFENAGLAKSVSRTRDGAAGDYQLILDIRSFQISTSAQPATAEIDFIAKLVDKDGKIVNASTFQGSAPVKGEGPHAYVNAVDEAFVKLAQDLIGWVTTALAEVPPPSPPSEPPSEESTEAQPG